MRSCRKVEHIRKVLWGSLDNTRRLTNPHIAILVISMFEDDDLVFAALQAGARGYLLKGALKAEILRSIRAVCSGEAIFGPTSSETCPREKGKSI